MRRILLSFVGTNDGGELFGQADGAILTALRNEAFDEVILLWNEGKARELLYSDIVKHISSKAKKNKLISKVSSQKFNLSDVTDHNQIYSLLKAFTDSLPDKDQIEYTAAISSGTPAMQVCWILLSESGDFSIEFPLRLIKVKDPKFGNSANENVKLDTSLPRIISLKDEIKALKEDLIPVTILNITRGQVLVNDTPIDLSPIEFCYYRYFVERLIENKGSERFSGIFISISFMKIIHKYHEESFPDLELNRSELSDCIKKNRNMGIQTFRGNISKLNKKISQKIGSETIKNDIKIMIEGKRGAKYYGIKGNPSKFTLKK